MLRQPHLFIWLCLTLLTSMSVSAYAYDCSTLAQWLSTTTYHGGDMVKLSNKVYRANWWTHGADPRSNSSPYQVWSLEGDCGAVKPLDKENQLPLIDLTSPKAGAIFNKGDQVPLKANACDTDGSIERVEFYVDNTPVGTVVSVPYAMEWMGSESGAHSVFARAIDDQGASKKTDAVSIRVSASSPENQPPQITLTAPVNGSEYLTGEVVKLMANASDKDGTVAKVTFYDNGGMVGIDTTKPYAHNWVAVKGVHRFNAVAVDDKGASAESNTAVVTVEDKTVPPGRDHCRPDGLYQTAGVKTPYCTVYDEQGREKMGLNTRRIIGYFSSWRNGADGKPAYLVNDIPWDKVTHINYAFAHVDDQHKISIGNPQRPENPATTMEWPGVEGAEMSPEFAYKGHFNLLSKYKQKYPHVKTLIAVGGWAESGGYLDASGRRISNGGFYTMTTHRDGSINQTGINTFADSVVDFLRKYGFDGADIDYEYATSMTDAGNPMDFNIANPLRANLMASYVELMKVLREKLDRAGEKDGKHYLLTVAAPASGYLVRGMETYQVTPYLDYVNIMTYDMHGGWNDFVGHNAALYDNGNDVELEDASIYTTREYGGIGYLNVDWAVKYFRGSLPPGRINIGIPYYTRGWKEVTGGEYGLNGRAALPDQSECPPGTGLVAKCGHGAIGIDNLWHDIDERGSEVAGGSNPLWHAKNLERGIMPEYLKAWGLNPETDPDDRLTGVYEPYYDSVAIGSWLWNSRKKVFLSIESKKSLSKKVEYVIDNQIGGIMIWELAGDYGWNEQKKEYGYGMELTDHAHQLLSKATAYGNRRTDDVMPKQAVDITAEIYGFKVGDQNYPLNPKLKITNRSGVTLPGGTEFRFDMPTSAPDGISDQSGFGLRVIKSGANASGNNIGGLKHTFHHLAFNLPGWKQLRHGESIELTLNYYLPITGPQAWTVTINGQNYALKFEYPSLPLARFDLRSTRTGCNVNSLE